MRRTETWLNSWETVAKREELRSQAAEAWDSVAQCECVASLLSLLSAIVVVAVLALSVKVNDINGNIKVIWLHFATMDMNAKEFAKANAKVEKNELDKCAHTHTAHKHTNTHTH